jgi:hypothetical protein
MSYTSKEGMRFSYHSEWSGHGMVADFGYGAQGLRIHARADKWVRMSEAERHRWRQAKYAEAERYFGIKRKAGA